MAYTLNSDGASYSVSGIGTCTDTNLVIPDTYEGLPVTKIGDRALELENVNGFNLSSITIPESITTIGQLAVMGHFNITEITIPKNVTYIGHNAFAYCSGVTSVTIETETPPVCATINTFVGLSSDCVFRVHNLSTYQTATNWSSLVTQYTFEEIEE